MRGNWRTVAVGEVDGATTDRIRALHRVVLDFEPDAILTDNIPGYLWGKLSYGAMLFATALAEASIAEVLAAPEHRPTIVALAREVVAVTEAPNEMAEASLDRLVAFNRASAKSHSGVWRDLAVR